MSWVPCCASHAFSSIGCKFSGLGSKAVRGQFLERPMCVSSLPALSRADVSASMFNLHQQDNSKLHKRVVHTKHIFSEAAQFVPVASQGEVHQMAPALSQDAASAPQAYSKQQKQISQRFGFSLTGKAVILIGPLHPHRLRPAQGTPCSV